MVQCRPECFPVVAVVDDVAELVGGIAVGSRVVFAVSAVYPCIAASGVGGDTGGLEEAVLKGYIVVLEGVQAYEATVEEAVTTFKFASEHTVAEGDFCIIINSP